MSIGTLSRINVFPNFRHCLPVSYYGTRMCGCLIVHELLSCCQWYMASVCSKKLRLISPLSPFFRNASRISQSPTTSTQTFNVNWCRKRSSSTSCGLPSAHILLFWKLRNVGMCFYKFASSAKTTNATSGVEVPKHVVGGMCTIIIMFFTFSPTSTFLLPLTFLVLERFPIRGVSVKKWSNVQPPSL